MQNLLTSVILVSEHPEPNEFRFRHSGCSRWIVPRDDCPFPTGDCECAECALILPLARVDDAFQPRSVDDLDAILRISDGAYS